MPAVECGCKWNNDLSHEVFEENVGKFGKEKALHLLRSDVQSWVRERDGKKFNFSYRVKNGQLENEALGKSITGMIEDSMYGPHVNTLAANVRENAPLEFAVAEEATRRAVRGDKEIPIIEYYRTESGKTVIRYITVLTQDPDNGQIYHGNRIDLGEDFSVKEGLKKAEEKGIIPVRSDTRATTGSSMEPRYSAVYTAVREIPHDALRVVSGTASEIGYTARFVRRYIEKRNHEKNEKRINIDPTSVDVWKRVMESGKKRITRVARRVKRPGASVFEALKSRALKKRLAIGFRISISERTSTQTKRAIDTSISRHEKRSREARMRMGGYKQITLSKEAQLKKNKDKKLPRFISDARMATFAEKILVKERKTGKEIIKIKHIETTDKEKAVRLSGLMKRLIRTQDRLNTGRVNRTEKRGVKKIEKKLEVREHALKFSVAFILWIQLAGRSHAQLYDDKQNKHTSTEALELREPTQWLLLAIIWHLAMIRESGMRTMQTKSKQNKAKKKTVYPKFAPQGVIFALAT